MKKKLLIAGLLAVCCFTGLNAQTTTTPKEKDGSSENLIHKGVNTINVYYGTNILGSVYKALASASAVDLKVHSLGPIGIVYEHLMTDHIGLGAEFGYSKFTMEYNETQTDYNGTVNTYKTSWEFTNIRAMVRLNFHFAKSERFDAYGLLSVGYRHTNYTFSTQDPFYTGKVSYGGIIPVGIKPGIGIRYFFTDNIGLNAEFALGTPLLCGGLSVKF